MDTIARKRTHSDTLQNLQDQLNAIIEVSQDLIFTLDLNGFFTSFAWTDAVKHRIHPDDVPGKKPHHILPAEEADALLEKAREVIATGEPISIEQRFLWRGQERTFNTRLHPIRNGKDEVEGVIGITRDLTEKIRLDRMLNQANRMADLYRDLIGKDIYNSNMVAGTLVEMLKDRVSDEEASELILRIRHTLEQSAIVIKNAEILPMLERLRMPIEPVDLNASIQALLKRYKGTSISYSGCKSTVWGNNLLEHAFANCVSNSIKFGGVHTAITIAVDETDENLVTVTIADDGIGIPDSAKPTIFNLFQQTLKSDPPGRGLGLHIVKTLITSYRGRVWAADRVPGDPEKGVAIKIILQKC